MDAKEFLREKGILAEGYNEWLVKYPSGKEICLAELMDEFLRANQVKVEITEKEMISDPEQLLPTSQEIHEQVKFFSNKVYDLKPSHLAFQEMLLDFFKDLKLIRK